MADTKPDELASEMEKGRANGVPPDNEDTARPISAASTVAASPNGSPRSSWRSSFSSWLPGAGLALKPKDPPNEAQPEPQKEPQIPIPPPTETIVRIIEETPPGFPRLAAFLDSDDNFMIYRRFGYLHARILLQKQDELKEIEGRLRLMDEADARGGPRLARCLMSRAHDERRARDVEEGVVTRGVLLRKAEKVVGEYGQLLLQAQQLVGMNRPGNRDYNSVRHYIEGKRPLLEDGDDFVYQREDLVTLRPGRECAWLDAFVERVLRTVRCKPIIHMFCSKDVLRKSNDPGIAYFSRNRIEYLVTGLITLFILLLLILPIYALYKLSSTTAPSGLTAHSNASCIGVLIVATLVFSAILSLFTKARRHEILGASAAYCAVLVVFIGGVGPRGS